MANITSTIGNENRSETPVLSKIYKKDLNQTTESPSSHILQETSNQINSGATVKKAAKRPRWIPFNAEISMTSDKPSLFAERDRQLPKRKGNNSKGRYGYNHNRRNQKWRKYQSKPLENQNRSYGSRNSDYTDTSKRWGHQQPTHQNSRSFSSVKHILLRKDKQRSEEPRPEWERRDITSSSFFDKESLNNPHIISEDSSVGKSENNYSIDSSAYPQDPYRQPQNLPYMAPYQTYGMNMYRPVGQIPYNMPFVMGPPVLSTSPQIPTERWTLPRMAHSQIEKSNQPDQIFIPIPVVPQYGPFMQSPYLYGGEIPQVRRNLSDEKHVIKVDKLIEQLKYYFSIDNLCKDMFLRSHMDSEGFVSLHFVFGFARIRRIAGSDFEAVIEAAYKIETLEVTAGKGNDIKIRLKNGWQDWIK